MNRNEFRTPLLVFGMALFFINASFAQRPNRGEGQKSPTFNELLEKMDANEDGKLSEKEVKGPLKNDFSKVDTNEDGFITEEELKKAPKPQRRKRD